MELWMEKALGRRERYSSGYLSDLLKQGAYKAYDMVVDQATGQLGYMAGITADLLSQNAISHTVGKKKIGGNLTGYGPVDKFAGWLAKKAVTSLESVEKDPSAYAQPAGDAAKAWARSWRVGSSVVAGACYRPENIHNENLRRELYNVSGHDLNWDKCLSQMTQLILQAPDIDGKDSDRTPFYDSQWRKEIMPEVLRISYQASLNDMFASMREQYMRQAEAGTLQINHEIMRQSMREAAFKLGQLYEDFSLKLANNSEFLEAPISLFKAERTMPKDLTSEESRRWKNLPNEYLFPDERELDKLIGTALKKVPPVSIEQTRKALSISRSAPVMEDGKEVPYELGKSPEEDERRFTQQVLAVRELKRTYENRTWLGRWLTPSGYAQRHALAEMQEELKSLKSPEDVAAALDLSKSFEDTCSQTYAQLSGIVPKEPLQKPSKTEVVTHTIVKTVESVTNALGITHDKAPGQMLERNLRVEYNESNPEINEHGEYVLQYPSVEEITGIPETASYKDLIHGKFNPVEEDPNEALEDPGTEINENTNPKDLKQEEPPKETEHKVETKPETKTEKKEEKKSSGKSVPEPITEKEVLPDHKEFSPDELDILLVKPKVKPKPQKTESEPPKEVPPPQNQPASSVWNLWGWGTSLSNAVSGTISYGMSFFSSGSAEPQPEPQPEPEPIPEMPVQEEKDLPSPDQTRSGQETEPQLPDQTQPQQEDLPLATDPIFDRVESIKDRVFKRVETVKELLYNSNPISIYNDADAVTQINNLGRDIAELVYFKTLSLRFMQKSDPDSIQAVEQLMGEKAVKKNVGKIAEDPTFTEVIKDGEMSYLSKLIELAEDFDRDVPEKFNAFHRKYLRAKLEEKKLEEKKNLEEPAKKIEDPQAKSTQTKSTSAGFSNLK